MRRFRVRITADGFIEAPTISEAVERMLAALPTRPEGACDITISVNVVDLPVRPVDA